MRLPPLLQHSTRLTAMVAQSFVPSRCPSLPSPPPPASSSSRAGAQTGEPPPVPDVLESGLHFSIQIFRRARCGMGRGGR
eukprot:7052939-Pyramimonas_sp.AAC.1